MISSVESAKLENSKNQKNQHHQHFVATENQTPLHHPELRNTYKQAQTRTSTHKHTSTMAGQSIKKQVQNNIQALKNIHILTWSSFTIFLLCRLYFHRPPGYKAFVFTSIPVLVSVFALEKTGRPIVGDNNKIIRAGQDLNASGLTEYLFDIIYYTVFLNVLCVVFGSNKPYYLWWIIPAYASYLIFGLIKAGKEMFGGGATPAKQQRATEAPQKSKRQQKLEARGDKQKVRYR